MKWFKCPKKLKHSLAVLVLFIYFLIGILFYNSYEGWNFITSLFFTVVTISTVGYGDYAPSNDSSRLFTIFYIIFGVYIIFYGFYEFANKGFTGMKNMVNKSVYGDPKEMYIHPRKRLLLAGSCLLICILIGAIVLKYNENWTFITALYYAIETSTTVGYGDIVTSHESSRIFLIFYIITSTCLVLYLINTINTIKRNNHEFKKQKKLLKQKQLFEHGLMELRSQPHTNNNNHHTVGMTKHQFVIFILKHLGIIDQHIHIDPWLSKFNELDGNQVGYLNAEQLRKFCELEKEQSQIEYIEMTNVTELDVLDDILDETGLFHVIPRSAGISATYHRVLSQNQQHSSSSNNNNSYEELNCGRHHHNNHNHQNPLYTRFLSSSVNDDDCDSDSDEDNNGDEGDGDVDIEAVRGVLV